MATLYQLRTFKDLYTAAREELGLASTDTTGINRIKRDINMVYNEVMSEDNWWWLRQNIILQIPAYHTSGTVAVSQGSNTVTASIAIAQSKAGYKLMVDGFNEIYTIDTHTAGSTTLKLTIPYAGESNSAVTYKIFTDKLPLPVFVKETMQVRHDHHSQPLDNVGMQEFRRITSLAPRAEGYPTTYSVGDFTDINEATTIGSLPSVSTRASSGLLKTLVFSSGLPASVTSAYTNNQQIRWRITNAAHSSYNGDFFIASISTTNVANDTVSFVGSVQYQESTTVDASLTIRNVGTESAFSRFREIYFHPVLTRTPVAIHAEVIKNVPMLENDSDEPAMPIEDRIVLLYGALHRGWVKQRNEAEIARNFQLYQGKLSKMQAKLQDTFDKPTLKPSKYYLAAKRQLTSSNILSGFTGGGSAGGQVVTGTPNRAAIFNNQGVLEADSLVSTTELEYLDGVTSNIQAQLDAITTLADGKILVGDGANVAQERTPTGDISMSNLADFQIVAGAIVNADVNGSAAIAVSKLAAMTASRAVVSDGSGFISPSAITSTEITYLDDVEPLTTVALADNQVAAADVVTWAVASFNVVHLDYSISRGASITEVGSIKLASDGTNASLAVSGTTVGASGVTFSADVNGGNLRLRFVSSNTGVAPSFKYKGHKWLA